MNAPTIPPATPSLPLVPSHEETLLREAVAGVAAGFGPAYIRVKVEAQEPPTELWDALATRGYLGVNVPAEYDGGGAGLTPGVISRAASLNDRWLQWSSSSPSDGRRSGCTGSWQPFR